MRDDSARAWRARIRAGEWMEPTAGLAAGYAQANLLAVPAAVADDFAAFCRRNPFPCPLLERLPAGAFLTREMAAAADVRSEVPRYRVYQEGRLVTETADARPWWREDLVPFLLGCSFTFEWALAQAGIPLAHGAQGRNVPMYRTSIPLEAVGPFRGEMVVSMRPIPPARVAEAAAITARFPRMHGGPIHVGEPAAIGIADLSRVDFGDAVDIPPDTVPVFWPCGVTSQGVTLAAAPDLAISHAPGHMLLLDRRHGEFDES